MGFAKQLVVTDKGVVVGLSEGAADAIALTRNERVAVYELVSERAPRVFVGRELTDEVSAIGADGIQRITSPAQVIRERSAKSADGAAAAVAEAFGVS